MLARLLAMALLSAPSLAFASVDVERFTTSTEQPGTAWIGKTLADALAADLIDLQNPHGARVIGSYQAIDNQIRVNAQVLDQDGKLIGAARVSGTTDDLFHLEDSLADTARALIARSTRQRANASAAASMPAEDRTPTRLVASGPLQRNLRANASSKWTDPHARAATWRYYYSSPIFNWTCNYGYSYSNCYGSYRYGGRPAFIFAAYQGGQNTY